MGSIYWAYMQLVQTAYEIKTDHNVLTYARIFHQQMRCMIYNNTVLIVGHDRTYRDEYFQDIHFKLHRRVIHYSLENCATERNQGWINEESVRAS